MRKIILLLIIAVLTLFSCSDSNVIISSADSFEIVKLPDGSAAYLNKNSHIEYNKNFDQRVVKQSGEVFFIVSKGEPPFIVKTDVGEIKVLGTEFNVKSNNQELEVEVEEGTVELKINKLINKITKGQKACFKGPENGIMIGKAEFKHINWISNLNNKELNKSLKHIDKDVKKLGKELDKELKKIKKNIKN